MFKIAKLETKKELSIKSSNLSTFQRYIRNKERPLTEKITNITFKKQSPPKIPQISLREKYLNNILQNSLKPYNDKNIIPKLSKIHRSRNNQNKTFNDANSDYSSRSKSRSINTFRSFSNLKKCRTEYKIKRSQSFFSSRTYNKEKILRTTNNSRIRKLYSMSSDIFNLEDCSTNLVENNSNYNTNIEPYIHLGNENNHITKNINYFTLENDDNVNNNKKPFLEKNKIKKYNTNINIKNIKHIDKPFGNKKFNKKSLYLNKDFANSDFTPFLHKIKSKTKTNASNIESVNYDIISNKENNLYDKYKNYSNKRGDILEYENYEIIIPKNYNKLDSSKLKNLMHAEGIHFFGLREQAKVSGDKGKFCFKIRKTNLNKNKKINDCKTIEKLSKKLSNIFNVKLKKYDENINKRKTTEVTRKYGPEEIANHLQDKNYKPLKR